MSENEKYFRLNPECFLVTGKTGSVIHNLYTGDAIRCNQENTMALAKSEANNQIDESSALFQELERRKWGFFSEKPPFVDKLRTFNVFREKRLWKETPYIAMAVLQITNACNRSCPSCQTAFCPICKVFPDRENGDGVGEGNELTTREWLDLIDELRRYGTQYIVFTGGEALLNQDLATLVRHAREKGIAVQVNTSGLIPLAADFPDAAFSILLTDAEQLPSINANFGTRHNVTILNSGVNPEIVTSCLSAHLGDGWRIMPVSSDPPLIRKSDLMQTGFDRFFARKQGDECLNGKIYVAYDGAVLPCFGHKGSPIAHLHQDGLPAAVKSLVETYWTVPIDKVRAGGKCVGCEYRYSCKACRYLDVGHRCTFQVDEGSWT